MTPVASLMTNPMTTMTTMTTIEITINPAPIIPGIYCFIVILMFVYKYKDAYNYQATQRLIILLILNLFRFYCINTDLTLLLIFPKLNY